ncbi:Serine/threonine kinase [Irineochytrium annulatum]|nr:Serine/threonine kinase [Irineochytrium annulatum]
MKEAHPEASTASTEKPEPLAASTASTKKSSEFDLPHPAARPAEKWSQVDSFNRPARPAEEWSQVDSFNRPARPAGEKEQVDLRNRPAPAEEWQQVESLNRPVPPVHDQAEVLKAAEEARIANEIKMLREAAAKKDADRRAMEEALRAKRAAELAKMREMKKQEEERKKLMAAAATAAPIVKRDVTIDDFNFLAVLGRGAFGKVMLAQEKESGRLYAIKALKKDYISESGDVKGAKLERRIFQTASVAQHPYLVADYGICKEDMPYGATTRTYCGTPDYMAPEILAQNKYDRAVDWWSFGVLLYVMLVGRYPFHGEKESDFLDSIMSDSVEYPSNMPPDTLSLLVGSSATDISNFDKEFTKEPPTLTIVRTSLQPEDQKQFSDFDYVADWAVP